MSKNMQNISQEVPALNSITGEIVSRDENALSNHPIELVLKRFLGATDDYRDAVKMALPAVAEKRIGQLTKVQARLERFVKSSGEDGTQVFQAKEAHEAKEMLDAAWEMERLAESRILPLLARSILIGVFSEYDSFVGGLLKAIYSKKPELYKAIKREVSLTDLLEFSNLEDVKKDMLEQEIDSFRRESYIEQFTALEKKFELRTLRDFPDWPAFVEFSQRRNIMTHNDGRASQQYISVCEREGVVFKSKPMIGQELELSPDYLFDAILIVSKVGFMLAHTLWRKILPEDFSIANESMNLSLFDLLRQKRWRVATAFGEFSMTPAMIRNVDDMRKMIRVVNTAIALKNSKKNDAAMALLDSVDWSACIREFKLANAVLKDDYATAQRLMIEIGKKGELLDQLAYHGWPLFEDFRGSVEFQNAYRDIYGVPFRDKVSREAQQKLDLEKSKEGANVQVEQAATPKSTEKKIKRGAKRKQIGAASQ